MKSNWKGTSGWASIDDPTGVLNGKVLVVTSGLSATTEDYLTQIPGTTVPFVENHYSVMINYGWGMGSGLHPLAMGELGLIARASNFIANIPMAYDAYIGKFNIETGKISIVKRYQNTETILSEANVPSDVIGKGMKHGMEFKCYGTNPVTLQFSVDNTIYCTYGDSSSSLLSSGFPGIHANSGTSYVDNFTIIKYQEDGKDAVAWLPNNSATTLAAWWKSDVGITESGGDISAWADQSGNANNLSQATPADKPKYIQTYIANLPIVSFTATNHILSASDTASLDITSGITLFAIVVAPTMGVPAERLIVTKGTNYELALTTANAVEYQTSTTDTSTSINRANSIQLIELVSGSNFYLNGVEAGPTTAVNGVANANVLDVQFKEGKIGEIIVYDGILTTDDRQKIEGYLTHKWRLSAQLPTTHPYRSYAPLL